MSAKRSVTLFLVLILTSAGATLAAERTQRPDILVILSDDVGYSDLGCYGGEIATPQLDALAAGGLRFTQFYNSARCCPTRASLLTGLHPHQAGVGHMMDDNGSDGYRGRLNRRCVTIAEALGPAGYRTYVAGKWHVTPGQSARALADTSNWPLQRGFDRFYGTIHGAGSYFDPSSLVRDNRLITVANDSEYQPKEYYYTDAIADHAVRFIREHAREHRDRPFFLYTAFTAAHWPLHAKDVDIAKYRGRYDRGYEPVRAGRRARLKTLGLLDDRWTPTTPAARWEEVKDRAFESRCMEVYAAQLDSMDQGIGRIVAELKAQGRFENTLIFYLQDNGGCAESNGRGPKPVARAAQASLPPMDRDAQQFDSTPKQTRDGWPVRHGLGVMPGGPDTYIAYGRGWANVSNTPFREYKHWTHEGGISTPLIVSWPAGLRNQTADASSRPAEGRLIRVPGQLPDIMATCLDAAKVSYPLEFRGEKIQPLEGRSLLRAFGNENTNAPAADQRWLYWEHEGNRAVRAGGWKLVARENQPWELYDLEIDRTETRDLASSEPARVTVMSAAWDAWAARARVLPLGAWRGEEANTNLNRQTRFELKPGQRLDRGEAPAIARRGFRVSARFTTEADSRGVIVAQGGSTRGYALHVAEGRLFFIVRDQGWESGVSTAIERGGTHTAAAKLDSAGMLRLQLDAQPEANRPGRGLIQAMPADGLEVGADEGGAVGAYAAPNRFTGKIESVVIDLETGASPPTEPKSAIAR